MLIMKLFFKLPLQALNSFSLMHPLLKFTEYAFVVIHLQVDKLYSSVPSHLRLLPLPYMLSTSKKLKPQESGFLFHLADSFSTHCAPHLSMH